MATVTTVAYTFFSQRSNLCPRTSVK